MNPISIRFSARIATLVLLGIPAQLAFSNDEPSPERFSVYAKVILCLPSPDDEPQPIVETWVAKDISKLGEESELRAVTDWVRLAGQIEEDTDLWNSVVDGKTQGCPVSGRVAELTTDGKFRVELPGWAPVPVEIIKGQSLPAEVGSRGIAIVDRGGFKDGKEIERDYAYVALFVGPAIRKSTHAGQTPVR